MTGKIPRINKDATDGTATLVGGGTRWSPRSVHARERGTVTPLPHWFFSSVYHTVGTGLMQICFWIGMCPSEFRKSCHFLECSYGYLFMVVKWVRAAMVPSCYSASCGCQASRGRPAFLTTASWFSWPYRCKTFTEIRHGPKYQERCFEAPTGSSLFHSARWVQATSLTWCLSFLLCKIGRTRSGLPSPQGLRTKTELLTELTYVLKTCIILITEREISYKLCKAI